MLLVRQNYGWRPAQPATSFLTILISCRKPTRSVVTGIEVACRSVPSESRAAVIGQRPGESPHAAARRQTSAELVVPCASH